MTPQDAVARLNTLLAHAWMIRTFLKHADEIQDDEEMLDVPRTLYDGIRAVEPAFERGDVADYLRRLKGKLPKFRRAAEHFAAHHKAFSAHTNFAMAALSLSGAVAEMDAVFAAVNWDDVRSLAEETNRGAEAPRSAAVDPLDDLDIPEV